MLTVYVEVSDINEVEQNGDTVNGDIKNVDDPLRNLFCDEKGRETIIKDDRDVKESNDRQIEAHAVEEQPKRFLQGKHVEELCVEKIQQPTTDAKCQ